MRISNPEKRLEKFWGRVDEKHIMSFFPFVKGRNVLDVGCGNGSTTGYLNQNGDFNCIGIDEDKEEIGLAKRLYPDCDFRLMNCEEMIFEDNYFETIVLRDVLHHLYEDADFEKVSKELVRVSGKNSRIIIFDPNVNFMLKTMRVISFHKDAGCNFETALKITDDIGYKLIHKSFNTLYSLPLSGGYVGINFVPQMRSIQQFILRSENFFERITNKLKLGRYLCWRYLIVGELKK